MPVFVVGAVLLAALMAFGVKGALDPDSFYHVGHGLLYQERGILWTKFPWASASVLSRFQSDLWWGFHSLLAPLGLVNDPLLRLQIGSFSIIFFHLLILAIAYQRMKLSPWWAIASLTGSGGELLRTHAIRPQGLSSALLVLAFVAMYQSTWPLCIGIGLLIGLVHPTAAFMILPVAACSFASKLINERGRRGYPELVTILSAIVGALLRPGAPDGLQLLKIQLIDLAIVRKEGLLADFGMELNPASGIYMANNVLGLVVLIAIGVYLWTKKKKDVDGHLWGSLSLAAMGLVMMSFLTLRGIDLAVPFAVLAVASATANYGTFPVPFLLAILANSGYATGVYLRSILVPGRIISNEVQAVSTYLMKNADREEIVFHPTWSQFGELFYWNRRQYYLGGMDPIFQYRFSPSKYWKLTAYAAGRKPGFTGPTNPKSEQATEEPLWKVVPRDFDSRWILLAVKPSTKALDQALKKDPAHYIERFRDKNSALYEIRGAKKPKQE